MKYSVLLLGSALFSMKSMANDIAVQVTDVQGKPVENIIVYATPAAGIVDLKNNTSQLTIGQKDKKFAPYVTVMQKGQQIEFANKDDITHHIYSVSGQNRFDFKLKAGASLKTDNMDAAEEVAMGCNIHDWMSGYVLVVDTPYYGKTDGEGVVTLPVAKTGEYELAVWHPQLDVKGNKVIKTIQVLNDVTQLKVKLPKNLLPLPEQSGQDDFDFLDEY